MIEWKCVEVGHHRKIAGVIEEYQREDVEVAPVE